MEGGYRMIFSNYEATYMDCGYGAWVGEGNNWCSPYKGESLPVINCPLSTRINTHSLSEEKSIEKLASSVIKL